MNEELSTLILRRQRIQDTLDLIVELNIPYWDVKDSLDEIKQELDEEIADIESGRDRSNDRKLKGLSDSYDHLSSKCSYWEYNLKKCYPTVGGTHFHYTGAEREYIIEVECRIVECQKAMKTLLDEIEVLKSNGARITKELENDTSE